jgi:hypothetical protein
MKKTKLKNPYSCRTTIFISKSHKYMVGFCFISCFSHNGATIKRPITVACSCFDSTLDYLLYLMILVCAVIPSCGNDDAN